VPWPAWQTTAAQSGIVREYDSQSTTRALGGTRAGSGMPGRLVVAITRTGSSRSPSNAAAIIRPSGSCEVLGAISTSGASPGGGSTASAGRSQSSGPVTSKAGFQSRRGYSSCGKVATSARSREIPLWV
jgi:hypothetical protein